MSAVVPEKKTVMRWYTYGAYFLGGAFLVNAMPHFLYGTSGRSYPTPLASPAGVGLSPPVVNVLWGAFNIVMGYLLVCRVGNFDLRCTRHVLMVGIGGLVMALIGSTVSHGG